MTNSPSPGTEYGLARDDESRTLNRNSIVAGLDPADIPPGAREFFEHLRTLGFTHVVFPSGPLDPHHLPHLEAARLKISFPTDLDGLGHATNMTTALAGIAAGADVAGAEISRAYQSTQNHQETCKLDLMQCLKQPTGAVALMLQMALPYLPVIEIGRSILGLPRDQAETVRSLLFWRTKFRTAFMQPRWAHLGEHGMLLFILETWLICLNWTPDEVDIDVGSNGSMWLMLATANDVHLHGSLLTLPAYTGAILANELARHGS